MHLNQRYNFDENIFDIIVIAYDQKVEMAFILCDTHRWMGIFKIISRGKCFSS